MKKHLFFLIFWIFQPAAAQVRLPQLISDGMVLQRDVPVKIWGWAAPTEKLTIDFIAPITNHQSQFFTQADAGGNWEITIPVQKAGGPYSINISGANSVTVQNILFGDVWLCSGQSNMETPVSRVMTMFGDEISAYSNPNIRYVKVPLTYNFHGPQADVADCAWTDLSPETALNFSAVAYFFAKEIFEKTGAPVGIINSSVGGSPAEAWISEEALKPFPAMLNDMRICQSDDFVNDMQLLGSLPGRRWNTVLNGQDKGLTESVNWSSPDYDDSSWTVVDLSDNSWGRKNFRPVNGVFWFRKEIDVPTSLAGQEAMLYVGRIIDADFTYINGQPVGNTAYQYPPRNYAVSQGLLKAGKNTITVRLISQNGIPGFVDDKPYRMVFKNGETISLEGDWKYRTGALMPPASGGGITFQYKPTGLFNAMIAPLKNHAFKGVLWYQGESNTDRYAEYYELMSLLIDDWRKLLGKDLPFLSVQLANYMEPGLLQQNSNWAELRNVQRKLSQTVPNTGMAVAIDIGEWNDIHPLNKKDVGIRLALQARKIVYGEKIVSDGPVYQSYTIDGNKLVITFREGTDHLKPVNDELKGFAVAGTDGIYKTAHAIIDGKRVVVWNDEIIQPVKARYAWANNPDGVNLYNSEGLPASPFQTE